jgi:hypothetical protein
MRTTQPKSKAPRKPDKGVHHEAVSRKTASREHLCMGYGLMLGKIKLD